MKEKKENPLFDLIKILFENPEKYKKVSTVDKNRYFFMINRLLGIGFPMQANAFNHIKISTSHVVDYWHGQSIKLYKKTPQWIYTSPKKAEVKKDIKWPSDEAVKFYLERTKSSKKDLIQAVKIFGEESLSPIFAIEKMMNE